MIRIIVLCIASLVLVSCQAASPSDSTVLQNLSPPLATPAISPTIGVAVAGTSDAEGMETAPTKTAPTDTPPLTAEPIVSEQPPATEVAAAVGPSPTISSTATTAPPETPTAQAPATATPEQQPTATPTPPSHAIAYAIGPTNLRKGPGTAYERVGSLQKGESLQITGKNKRGTWWQLQGPKGEPVWIIGNRVEAKGPVEAIEVAANIPPRPAAPAAPSAPAPRPAGSGNFGYGIQIQPYYGADNHHAANAIRDLGFNWVKWQVVWRDMERGPGQIDWGEQDGLIGHFSGQGLNILTSVVKAPHWARPAGTDLGVEGPPADPQTFANFLGAFAGRYCGQVKAIEVWNEQNLHHEWGNEPLDAARYMELLRRAYGAIKAACPQMIVVSGALTPVGDFGTLAIDDFRYLEAMYQNGLKGYSDAIGAHPSGYNVPPQLTWKQACDYITSKNTQFRGPCDTPHHSWAARSTVEGYRNIMAVYGDANKRIWPTEFGWAAGGALDPNYMYANDNSRDDQARWTREFYQWMRGTGYVGPAFLWNLNFSMINPGTQLSQWSIVNEAGEPLPVYHSLKAMPK